MNERIEKLRAMLLAKEYRAKRCREPIELADSFSKEKIGYAMRAALRLKRLAEEEEPSLCEWDRIGFRRSTACMPPISTEKEWAEIRKKHFVFDFGWVANINSDYKMVLARGFKSIREEIEQRKADANAAQKEEAEAMIISLRAVDTVVRKYRTAAKAQGLFALAEALSNVPEHPPRSFYEACVMLRLLNFMLWLNDNKHVTVGRFDQYMYPYFRADVEAGVLDETGALEIIEELFISLNFDADLYPGVQQGDNGQSLVLGGCDKDGNPAYNELSRLCLIASAELKLIDPKINLRVDKNTPREIYLLGTTLTAKGLGFPQYSNDDVVIPALCRWGYALEDARNYVVAACWEFIVPGKAFDINNVDGANLPRAVDRALREGEIGSYREFRERVRRQIDAEVASITAPVKNLFFQPSPLQSVLMDGCAEELKDVSEGLHYNNMGLHGVGIAKAADAMAAVKYCVCEQKTVPYGELLRALDADFEGFEDVRSKLLSAPKMGNNDDFADDEAVFLLGCFADSCEKRKNDRGGIWRAGTGTAMYYIWYSETMGATADGRRAGTAYSANYSPSLDVKTDGVLSVISSFTKPDLGRVCNGGPLTLEFHDTVFRNEEGMGKVADLVRMFVALGGHQLQLNAINRETLLDAQKHPEKYPQLIVRVWGWSGYFNELDLCYQQHVIRRLEF